MSSVPQNDLSYGRLGNASYDERTGEWRFQRRPGISRILRPVADASTILRTTLRYPDTGHRVKSRAEQRADIRRITLSEPSLVGAAHLLPVEDRLSAAVTRATDGVDPVSSNLLAFGTAYDVQNERPVQVVAVPGGATGQDLRLLRVRNTTLISKTQKGLRLAAPSINEKDLGWWAGGADPIQQVCFSECMTEPRHFAVRRRCVTSIFRPCVQRIAVRPAARSWNLGTATPYTSSRLDPGWLIDLGIDRTGGAPHAHIAFSPFNERQFAIIDVCGYWGIWSIEGRRSKQRNLRLDHSGLVRHGEARRDGWGTVLWAADSNTLVAANRWRFVVHDVGSKPRPLKVPKLQLGEHHDWILGCEQSPSSKKHIFVLTLTRIFWLHVLTEEERNVGSNNEHGAEILISWQHFRGIENTGLRLSTISLGQVITVVLYDQISELMTSYALTEDSGPQLMGDPSEVPYIYNFGDGSSEDHPGHEAKGQHRMLSCLILRPVWQRISRKHHTMEAADAISHPGETFVQFFACRRDLSVVERLYVHGNPGSKRHRWVASPGKRNAVVKSATKVAPEDFVVADGFLSDDEEDPDIRDDELDRGFIHKANKKPGLWTVNYEQLAMELERRLVLHQGNSRTVGSLDQAIYKFISGRGDSPPGILTLADLWTAGLPLDDIENVSSMVRALFNNIHDAAENDLESDSGMLQQLQVHTLLTPTMASDLQGELIEQGDTLLNMIYTHFLDTWIGCLESGVPGRTRIGIERDVRQVAVQVFLTSHGVQSLPKTKVEALVNRVGNDERQIVLPVRRKRSATSLSIKSAASDCDRAQAYQNDIGTVRSIPRMLRTPEVTPSVYYDQLSSPFPRPESSPYGLDIYAPVRQGGSLSASMQRVLGHWTVGGDPDEYNWKATNRALEDSETDLSENQTPNRQKRRLRRLQQKREGHDDQQQQQAAASSSQPEIKLFASSQTAGFLPSSQAASNLRSSQAPARAGPPKKRKRGF